MDDSGEPETRAAGRMVHISELPRKTTLHPRRRHLAAATLFLEIWRRRVDEWKTESLDAGPHALVQLPHLGPTTGLSEFPKTTVFFFWNWSLAKFVV